MNHPDTLVSYGASIWQRRYFWGSMVLLDLRNRYKRSILGLGWTLANPLAMTFVLCVVFCSVFGVNIRDYAPFVLSGMAFWNYLNGSVIEGCQCLYAGEAYIRSSPAPLAIYPLRQTLGLTVHFAAIFSLTLIVTILCRGFGTMWAWPCLIPAVVMLFLMCWSLATIFGFANVFCPDVQHLSSIAMQLLFYLSPVFCPVELLRSRGLGVLVDWNPIAQFMELIRAPLLEGRPPTLWAIGLTSFITLLTMTTAYRLLRKYERTVIFRM